MMIRMNTGRKWFIKAAALACAAMLMTPLTAFAGWQKEGDTYAYYEEDGTRVVNDFRRSGNQWFYLDENGHILFQYFCIARISQFAALTN